MAQSRRQMFAAGAALAFAAPAAGLAAAAQPDAELIRLCARFDVLEQQATASVSDHPCGSAAGQAADARRNRIVVQQKELLDRIVALPCLTPAGVFAVGRSLAGYLSPEELEDESNHDIEHRLLAAMLRAVTRGQGRPAASASAFPAPALAPPPSPDVALIALCERYVQAVREYRAISEQGVYLDFSDPEFKRIDRAAGALIPSLHAMREQIADASATTLDGLRAKANASRYWMSVDTDTARPSLMREEDTASWSLVQDVLRIV